MHQANRVWILILKVMAKNLSKGVTWSELYGVEEGEGLSQEADVMVHVTNGDNNSGKSRREWGQGHTELSERQDQWTG